MKRLTALLLALLLALPAVACADTFHPRNINDAREQALEAFNLCAFSAEYNSGGRNYIVRWKRPIKIYVAGNPTTQDLKTLDAFIMELGLRVPCMPPVTRINSQSGANVVMHFCRLSEMGSRVPGYQEGNWGYFTFSYNDYLITKATIGISTDVTSQLERNHLIQEEFVGALGLANDHWMYEDSILYQGWTTVQHLSELDWLMLNFLYSPQVKPGNKQTQADKALRQFYGF